MSEVRHGRRNPWRSFESSILEDTRFTTVETLVYIVIESHATTTDQRSFPSYNTIAKKAKCDRSTAIRAVKKLVAHNLLYKIERFKSEINEETKKTKIENTSNLYVIFPASEPFDPENEWIDQNGIVQEKGVVAQNHPNKTNVNKTNVNKTTYQQPEIEAVKKEVEIAQEEVSVTEDKNMVVDVKLDVFNNFGIELSNQEVHRLIKHASKHNKNLSEVIQTTKDHFLSSKKPINDLVASLMHGVTNGWDKPKKAKVSKPFPRSIREADKQVQNMQPEESEEDLESTYADIQATMRFLRSTEKQVLHNKE